MSYTPLDRSLLTSTVLKEGPDVVATWALILASMDKMCESDLQSCTVASLLRISEDRAEVAFRILSNPDPKSRNEEFGGRRIAPIEGGRWQVLSGPKYKKLASKKHAADRQGKYEQNRKAVKDSGEPWVCESYGCYEQAVAEEVGGLHVCSRHAFQKPIEEAK